jgi:hypothetical protein
MAFGCALLVFLAPAGLLFYFVDLPNNWAYNSRANFLFAYRPAGSLSRDYHLLADVFCVSRYAVGSVLHRAIASPHKHLRLEDTLTV